jgi:hypothetical protein
MGFFGILRADTFSSRPKEPALSSNHTASIAHTSTDSRKAKV